MAQETVGVKEEGQCEMDTRAGQLDFSISVECERVKEEPESTQEQDSSLACSLECGVSAEAARAGLYAEHEVKDELVLGPEQLQLPDSHFSRRAASKNVDLNTKQTWPIEEAGVLCPAEDLPSQARSINRVETQACSVKLVRLPVEKHKLANTLCRTAIKNQKHEKKVMNHSKHSAVSKLYSCDYCGEHFARKQSIIQHLRLHCEAPKCKVAPNVDLTAKQISSESSRIQAVSGNGQIRPCSVKLERLGPVSNTVRRACLKKPTNDKKKANGPPTKLYICDHCGAQFPQKNSIITHLKLHAVTPQKRKHDNLDKEFMCEICPKQFSNKKILMHHIQTHTAEKSYECDVCKRRFLRSETLANHRRTHSGHKPFKCEICAKRFLRLVQLRLHNSVHTGDKPYKCEICKKRVGHLSTLKNHRKIHTGEKKYNCDVCMMGFYRQSQLEQHRRVHTGERPFKCEICMKQFVHKRNLVQHLEIHTGRKPFECEVCSKQFYRHDHLVAHRRVEYARMQRSKAKKRNRKRRKKNVN